MAEEVLRRLVERGDRDRQRQTDQEQSIKATEYIGNGYVRQIGQAPTRSRYLGNAGLIPGELVAPLGHGQQDVIIHKKPVGFTASQPQERIVIPGPETIYDSWTDKPDDWYQYYDGGENHRLVWKNQPPLTGIRFRYGDSSTQCYPDGYNYQSERILGQYIFLGYRLFLEVPQGTLIIGSSDIAGVSGYFGGEDLPVVIEHTIRIQEGYITEPHFNSLFTINDGPSQNNTSDERTCRIRSDNLPEGLGIRVYTPDEISYILRIIGLDGETISETTLTTEPIVTTEVCTIGGDGPDTPTPENETFTYTQAITIPSSGQARIVATGVGNLGYITFNSQTLNLTYPGTGVFSEYATIEAGEYPLFVSVTDTNGGEAGIGFRIEFVPNIIYILEE